MATGIANAIIYVRGIDLLSKPIQRAAAQANRLLKKLPEIILKQEIILAASEIKNSND